MYKARPTDALIFATSSPVASTVIKELCSGVAASAHGQGPTSLDHSWVTLAPRSPLDWGPYLPGWVTSVKPLDFLSQLCSQLVSLKASEDLWLLGIAHLQIFSQQNIAGRPIKAPPDLWHGVTALDILPRAFSLLARALDALVKSYEGIKTDSLANRAESISRGPRYYQRELLVLSPIGFIIWKTL